MAQKGVRQVILWLIIFDPPTYERMAIDPHIRKHGQPGCLAVLIQQRHLKLTENRYMHTYTGYDMSKLQEREQPRQRPVQTESA